MIHDWISPRARVVLGLLVLLGWADSPARGGDPDPKSYWDVSQIRPGMKGTGRTVMVGTKLEEFQAEVLGVMKDVSPGRDMVLCRLHGCNLEHAGIIQGMSGSPIMIEGKLLGAVAFAWEFAKDPIAGVTPFSQMIQYVRSSDRRVAAERGLEKSTGRVSTGLAPVLPVIDEAFDPHLKIGLPAAFDPPAPLSGVLGGMRPIATPLAARGFSPRSLEELGRRLEPFGMAPVSAGAAPDRVVREAGDRPLVPGSPLSIALVMGDFDISGIGTVTHVEGDRVYGFGHPMLGLGACELPMMTGYIHTVYPRASVSMKLGSPLKVVGVIDADVSTSVSGRVGPRPDLLPLSTRVKTGRFADTRTYRVQIVREPRLLPTLVLSVLTSAIDTEGNLPEDLTARFRAVIELEGRAPIVLEDVYSGPRFTGVMGAAAMFSPVSSIVGILTRNPVAPVRIKSIDCDLAIEPGRTVARIESARLVSDVVEPGGKLRAVITLKPYRGEPRPLEMELPVPADYPEGPSEVILSDISGSIRREFHNDPTMLEPRDLDGLFRVIRLQADAVRTSVVARIPSPEKAVSVRGRNLTELPGSVSAVFSSKRDASATPLHRDLVTTTRTGWVIEGSQTLRFNVVKDAGLSLSLPGK